MQNLVYLMLDLDVPNNDALAPSSLGYSCECQN